ncbi:MAG TPA: hypothetical protein VKX49_30175 [Bryobacteraceae bacterium]|nr:hypothetical protein [Bryobacteraceae bacterium]
MTQDLNALKAEMEQYLQESGLVVFHSHARSLDSAPTIFWDTQRRPDFREFLQAAKTADVKLIVLHQREFAAEQIDDALEQLRDCEMPRDDFRDFERRLKQARAYDGSVCEIELSFSLQGTIYAFDVRTAWYQDYSEAVQEIDLLTAVDEDEDNSIGGYFSKN